MTVFSFVQEKRELALFRAKLYSLERKINSTDIKTAKVKPLHGFVGQGLGELKASLLN